jgi:hypothetical protein
VSIIVSIIVSLIVTHVPYTYLLQSGVHEHRITIIDTIILHIHTNDAYLPAAERGP